MPPTMTADPIVRVGTRKALRRQSSPEGRLGLMAVPKLPCRSARLLLSADTPLRSAKNDSTAKPRNRSKVAKGLPPALPPGLLCGPGCDALRPLARQSAAARKLTVCLLARHPFATRLYQGSGEKRPSTFYYGWDTLQQSDQQSCSPGPVAVLFAQWPDKRKQRVS